MHFPADHHKMIKLGDAQRILKTDRSTIENLIKTGTVPAKKIGKQWHISGKDLMTLLENSNYDQANPYVIPYHVICPPDQPYIGDWT